MMLDKDWPVITLTIDFVLRLEREIPAKMFRFTGEYKLILWMDEKGQLF
jgi:hypothetical protein